MKRNSPRLSLQRSTLRPLTHRGLAFVAGGDEGPPKEDPDQPDDDDRGGTWNGGAGSLGGLTFRTRGGCNG